MSSNKFIVPLSMLGAGDVEEGIRCGLLGGLIQDLSQQGINISDGFVITAQAYKHFLSSNQLESQIRKYLRAIEYDNKKSLNSASAKIRQLILGAKFPAELHRQIISSYNALSKQYHIPDTYVAIYSSVVEDDVSDLLFDSQREAYINVRGAAMLTDIIKRCFADQFTDQAISYRYAMGHRLFNIGTSVCIRKMVRPGLAASGLACALDTGGKFTGAVVINGSYGPGQLVMQKKVSADEFVVLRSTLQEPGIPIIEKKMGDKGKMMIYGSNPYEETAVIPTDKIMQCRFCLEDEQVLMIARWVIAIEKFARNKGYWFPLNIEWAIDGRTNQLFVVGISGSSADFRKRMGLLKSLVFDVNCIVFGMVN
ncbi:PEP/pyruvate-binding domain-containing protein [Chitinophaga sp. MM2321]|uniref:PEP/pyruvate-binding domain-containing protein n=1 Tax=Chitinophaga sp. MM2321 TaxID=3137178 RepID=UPI0032D586A8